MRTASRHSARGARGVLSAFVQAEHPDRIIARACDFAWLDRHGKIKLASDRAVAEHVAGLLLPEHMVRGEDIIFLRERNAYVNLGLNNALDREWGLGGSAIGYIGVSSNTTAVTASTTFLNGGSGGTAANTIIKAISPAATRSSQTTTGGATVANADFTSGVFAWNKIGLLTTSTDAGTGLVDVIGGTGGSAPYDDSFTVNLVNAGTFSVVAQIAVTATAV